MKAKRYYADLYDEETAFSAEVVLASDAEQEIAQLKAVVEAARKVVNQKLWTGPHIAALNSLRTAVTALEATDES